MDSSLKLQMDVRNNAQDLQNYMLDLNNWEDEMKRKELELKNEKPLECLQKIPPPRNKTKRSKTDCNKSSLNKPKKISAYDYSAWDKFDVDKACAEIDGEESDEKDVRIQEPNKEKNSESEDEDNDANEREKKLSLIDEAFYEKELGNQFVKKEQWNDAIKCYTNAINLDSKNAVYYANRSLCFLKLKNFKSAEVDATVAIQLDKNYIKAYQRRAFVRLALGQLAEAKADYEEVLRIEPKNALARVEIDKINAKLRLDSEVAKPIMKKTFNPKEIFKSEEKKPKMSKTTDISKIKSSKKISAEIKKSDVPIEGKIVKNIESNEKELKVRKIERGDGDKEILEETNNEKCGFFKPLPQWCTIIKPVNIPPHKRSKKPLKTIKIVEVTSDEEIDYVGEEKSIPITVHTKEEEKTVLSKLAEDDSSVRERLSFEIPKTSIQFQNCWKILKKTPEEALSYLKKISGKRLPQVLESSLESDFFSELINFLSSENVKEEPELVYEFLVGLSNVKRFASLIMFLSKQDKDCVRKCISQIEKIKSKEEILELCSVYEL